MLINIFRNLLLTIIIFFTITSCSNVQKAFDPERKNSSEEFLVEKKLPLSIPPDFEKLPVPQSEKINEKKKVDEFQILIENEQSKNIKSQDISDSEIENVILEKIKSN